MNQSHYINGCWLSGDGSSFQSLNPVTKEVVWEGTSADSQQVNAAVASARASLSDWSGKALSERQAIIIFFAEQVEKVSDRLAVIIAKETGKPLWESKTEVMAIKGKIALSIGAYSERTGTVENSVPVGKAMIRHKSHGVVAVFGPYNFPGHLPNGHIVPALLAGNTIVFKPSELAPATAKEVVKLWEQSGLPAGVLNLVQGGKETGMALAANPDIDGLFFTGSSATGKLIHKQFGGHPEKMLALEMGGNNPLIVTEVKNRKAAIHDTIHSSFITAGQRCTCSRRLFVPSGSWGDKFLDDLVSTSSRIKVGCWDDDPQPFMGALISEQAADSILSAQQKLLTLGATSLLESLKIKEGTALLSPGIIDVTKVKSLPDEEYFGPLLQVIRYENFKHAIEEANNTRYGLSAGLFSEHQSDYDLFFQHIRAGIVNWNRPITGSSSAAPFGGVGESGNHRPSAYFAADYCSYPVASVESSELIMPEKLAPGLSIL
ncbi:MAG: succinylglutamate-semialdehyde dehydrogenase [Candidatus Endonucleobacter bathymodioli]|uniref:N-succinylglutamate 5-semialdehyde dehydrogenase n=1 Tax=Candidatus Endonucleibacter bathymodioli TaxID=539814 RepID=A0AA90SNB9_9GAMM|nr:succinylglutamate-semialdehyde dehydrogenase [Candidatus Endonucleobacter bathymodioli]